MANIERESPQTDSAPTLFSTTFRPSWSLSGVNTVCLSVSGSLSRLLIRKGAVKAISKGYYNAPCVYWRILHVEVVYFYTSIKA